MSMPVQEIRKPGAFGLIARILFYIFNAFMLLFVSLTWTSHPAPPAGAPAGVIAATEFFIIATMWAVGAGILGVLVLATKGDRLFAPINSPEYAAYRKRKFWSNILIMVLLGGALWAGISLGQFVRRP